MERRRYTNMYFKDRPAGIALMSGLSLPKDSDGVVRHCDFIDCDFHPNCQDCKFEDCTFTDYTTADSYDEECWIGATKQEFHTAVIAAGFASVRSMLLVDMQRNRQLRTSPLAKYERTVSKHV